MLGFGWTDYVNPVWEATAVGNYPYILNQKDWFTSRYLTLSRTPVVGSHYALTTLSETSYPFTEGMEWGRSVTFSCDSLSSDIESLAIVAHFHNSSEVDGLTLVVEVHEAETDSLVLWHSTRAEDGNFGPGSNVVADAIVFDEHFSPQGKTIKTYLWNQGRKGLVWDKTSYYAIPKSKILTGIYDPIN